MRAKAPKSSGLVFQTPHPIPPFPAQPASGESYPRKPRQVLSPRLDCRMCCKRLEAHPPSCLFSRSISTSAFFGHSVSKLGRPVLVSSTVFIAISVYANWRTRTDARRSPRATSKNASGQTALGPLSGMTSQRPEAFKFISARHPSGGPVLLLPPCPACHGTQWQRRHNGNWTFWLPKIPRATSNSCRWPSQNAVMFGASIWCAMVVN